VTDLVQGDVREHLPMERIPLLGDVLGLGTTTSVDNGELVFLHHSGEDRTRLFKGQAFDASVQELRANEGSYHFPYVCFTDDAEALRHAIDPAVLGPADGRPLEHLIAAAIAQLAMPHTVMGIRLGARWHSLVITVASKLCMGQQRRNALVSPTSGLGTGLYEMLQHYLLAEGPSDDPHLHFLGQERQWECCGFYDPEPELGRVTLPVPGAHLHIHGCSTNLRRGGHLHHEHPATRLWEIEWLLLYPFCRLESLGADLAVEELLWEVGELRFRVANVGALDVSDVGVVVVVDDRYSSRRFLRLPWLPAGARESFAVPLALPSGAHAVEVVVDPEGDVIEPEATRGNNKRELRLTIGATTS
jgi:hypothetical protein